MRISLCMITRDEERNLDRCLASAKECIDEICILDTGSTDRTIEVAQRRGARVRGKAWQDDFSAARNLSLEMATGDWILVLDADEVLAPGSNHQLRTFASTHPSHAGHLTVCDRDIAGALGEVRTHVTRFFPRHAQPAFVGRIHEQILFAGTVPPRAHTGAEIVHLGYSPSAMQSRGKNRRNIRILREELTAQPESTFHWYQLGLTHLVAGDFEPAVHALASALGFADTSEPYIAHLAESLGYALRGLGRFDAAHGLMSESLKSYTTRPDTVFLHALLSMDLGYLNVAEQGFEACLDLAGSRPIGGAYSPAATTVGPAHNLGVLHEVTGSLDRARNYYQMALAFDPQHQASLAALDRVKPGRSCSPAPTLRQSAPRRATHAPAPVP